MKPYLPPEIKVISLKTEEILSQSANISAKRRIYLPEDNFKNKS